MIKVTALENDVMRQAELPDDLVGTHRGLPGHPGSVPGGHPCPRGQHASNATSRKSKLS